MWSVHVYDQQGQQNNEEQKQNEIPAGQTVNNPDALTQTQLENLFPEFRARLRLYHNCCDGNGKVVKNFMYYKQYRLEGHKVRGRRPKRCNKKKVQ